MPPTGPADTIEPVFAVVTVSTEYAIGPASTARIPTVATALDAWVPSHREKGSASAVTAPATSTT